MLASEATDSGANRNQLQLVEPAPAPRCKGIPTSERYVGSSEPETAGYLPRGEGSEGQIPRALPVRNKTGTASKGVSRQEGSQTLKTERDGQATPVRSVPSMLHVL